jgi:hypothetical protein
VRFFNSVEWLGSQTLFYFFQHNEHNASLESGQPGARKSVLKFKFDNEDGWGTFWKKSFSLPPFVLWLKRGWRGGGKGGWGVDDKNKFVSVKHQTA